LTRKTGGCLECRMLIIVTTEFAEHLQSLTVVERGGSLVNYAATFAVFGFLGYQMAQLFGLSLGNDLTIHSKISKSSSS